MTGLILYIIKSSLFLTVFYSFFMLVMRRTTFFRFNRIAFITGTAVCMVLPFMNIELPAEASVNAPMMVIQSALNSETVALEGAVVTAGEAATSNVHAVDIIFIAGALLSFLTTMASYIRMRRLMKSSTVTISDGMKIRIIEHEIPSFSRSPHRSQTGHILAAHCALHRENQWC